VSDPAASDAAAVDAAELMERQVPAEVLEAIEAMPADADVVDGPDSVDRLIGLLDLEPLGDDRFRAAVGQMSPGDRVFGGQVAAQALHAASATVGPEHAAHSMHAYFVRPGRNGVPIDLDVERTRDGRSFTTRRVLARQGDEVIFEMSASFHQHEDGRDYQLGIATGIPAPDDAPERTLFMPEALRARMPMEMREVGPAEPDEHGWYPSTRRAWMRIKRPIGDDPVLHQSLLAYLSDMGAMFAAMAPPEGGGFPNLAMGASLDHTLWFHRPMRADEWFLYDLHAVSNASSRGLARGTMHSADGVLGVSVAQEALFRMKPAT
jgi:acyl-CoA thioesterase-2